MKIKLRKVYYEITMTGLLFIGVTGFVFIAAMNSQANLLFWALGVMVGAFLMSGVFGWIFLRGMHVTRMLADHAVARAPMDVQYLVTNEKRRWPCFALRLTEARYTGDLTVVPEGYCLHLSPGQSTTVRAHLVAPQRGLVELAELRICCSFPFGFINRAVHLRMPRAVVVYPRIGQLNSNVLKQVHGSASTASLSSTTRGGHDEFYGLREYRPGDNVRAIHWRRTARTGELVVREMTAEMPPTVLLMLDLRQWSNMSDGRGQAERAIELAASWVCHAMQQNFAVAMLVPGLPESTGAVVQAHCSRGHRALLLETLARIDLEKIRPDAPLGMPKLHLPRECINVTLRGQDDVRGEWSVDTATTTLAMDDPGSANWVSFDDAAPPAEPAAPAAAQAADIL